jgi:hypothetical protein
LKRATRLGKQLIETTFDAIVQHVLKRKSETARAIDALHDIANKHAEFATQVHKGHMRDKAWLQDMVEHLARENRMPLRELPDPVGKTVRLIQVGDVKRGPIIDEPSAEVLRARDELELGDSVEYNVKIEGVFKTNGACKIRLLDESRIVSGKIMDPALERPGNVYTKALNEGAVIHVTAKPTLKSGKLHKLFISHATILRGREPQKGRTSPH